MKKVLAIAAVICLVGSISFATTDVRVWLEVPTDLTKVKPGSPVASETYFQVQVWAEILGGTAGQGISDMAVTIYSPDSSGVLVPRTNAGGTSVITSWGSALSDVEMKISASPSTYLGHTGAAVEASFANGSYGGPMEVSEDIGIGPTLLMTQTWKWMALEGGTLAVVVDPGSRYWASTTSRVLFDSISPNQQDPLAGSVVIPEPITMTMVFMGISGLGTMVWRRRKAA